MLVVSAIGILLLISAFSGYIPYYLQPAEASSSSAINLSNTAVDVAGLGTDKPYDSRYNGIAGTTVTVVPEFPSSILVLMAVVATTVIAITRSKKFLINTVERSEV